MHRRRGSLASSKASNRLGGGESGRSRCRDPQATEADDLHDHQYHKRLAQAEGAGLLWGASHYAGPLDVHGTKQADFFLDVEPEEDEFLYFDRLLSRSQAIRG